MQKKMKLNPTKHEDHRRILTEWISDIPVKRCKIIEMKEKGELGNHYHNNSDSVFFLMKGKGFYKLKPPRREAKLHRSWMFEGDCIFVPRGVVHTFTLWPGSILLEACSEPYNGNDEIQYTE